MSRMPPLVEADHEHQSIYRSEVVWAGTNEALPSHEFKYHMHDFWEFIYITDGEGEILAGQIQCRARIGDLLVYPPNVGHVEKPDTGKRLAMKVLSIVNTSDMDFMEFWPIDDPLYTCISSCWLTEAFNRLTDRILEEYKRMEFAYAVRVKALSLEFQSYLVQFVNQNSEKLNSNLRHQHVIRSRQYIQAHYRQNIRLADIAANSFVSMYYLSHSFKKSTGFTPMNYLTTLRIFKAQEMLSGTRHSISEISQLVGYDDLQRFSNTFKKYTGYSPRIYRQMQLNNQREHIKR
ncbi:MAG: AraC family transcriptional regulator [Clostridia bacterium]|nr:AraC family transcriptional regulator [Clostridia bacterium]